MTAFTTRFAPSPTGLLHLGHAFSALTAHDAARAAGGRLLLRIEDIDQGRCRPEYEASIIEDLAWLGVRWESGVRRQSEHFADYAAAIAHLAESGLVYRCFRTRAEILDEIARAPHLSPDGPEGPVYVGAPLAAYEERSLLSDGAAFAWRLSSAAAIAETKRLGVTPQFCEEAIDGSSPRLIDVVPRLFGDPVLGRKDSGASYHLASVFDDARDGVTHVIRGEDLKAAAHLHALLQTLLQFKTPVYRHHRLITDETGRRLAKRDHAATLRSLRAAGVTPAAIRAQLGLPPAPPAASRLRPD